MDANSFIYLVKSNLFHKFYEFSNKKIIIDSSVYKEVVEDGIRKNYPDAFIAKKYIEDYKIDVIPINIESTLPLFRDPGETSCYLLAQKGGICLTSDIKAIKKMIKYGIETISIDEFFYNLCLNKKVSFDEFEDIILKLQNVYATTEIRAVKFLKELLKVFGKN